MDRIEDIILDDDDSSSSFAAAATRTIRTGLLYRDENILLSRGSSSSSTAGVLPPNLSVTQLEEPSGDVQLRTTYYSTVGISKRRRHQRRLNCNRRGMLADPYLHTSRTPHEMNNKEQENSSQSPEMLLLSQEQQKAEDLRILHRIVIRNALKALDDL